MLAVAPGCELEVERGPDWLFVRVADSDQSELQTPPLAERVWNILRQHFTYRLVLELDQVSSLTSRLVAELVQLHRRVEEHGGVMRLCGLSPSNRQVLRKPPGTPFDAVPRSARGPHGPRSPRPASLSGKRGQVNFRNGPEGKKGISPIYRNGPVGASHKLDLSPFSRNAGKAAAISSGMRPGLPVA